MAKSGNTWCKKLMAIEKREWMKRNLGTRKRFDERVDPTPDAAPFAGPDVRVAYKGDLPARRADYTRQAGKWKHI